MMLNTNLAPLLDKNPQHYLISIIVSKLNVFGVTAHLNNFLYRSVWYFRPISIVCAIRQILSILKSTSRPNLQVEVI